jgi:regulator of replication initiation timing
LIFLLARFLLLVASSAFVQNNFLLPLLEFSPRAVIPSVSTFRKTLKHLRTIQQTPNHLLDALALPFYILHQLGFSNLPPHKEGESIIFRRTTITVLVPLWCCALTAAMVLFTIGSVTEFLSRTVMGMFRRQPKTPEWHQLDVERGMWQPQSPNSSSTEDMTKMPGAWGSAKVWEDLRRDQGVLQQERGSFDAEKAAWKAEVAKQMEEKRAFDLEKQRLREERLALQQQQQKFQAEMAASTEARKEVEGIIKMFVEKSKRSGEIIGNLKNRVERLPVMNGNMMGNPTPPASPKIEKVYRSEKVEIATPYSQNKRKARIQAAATAIAV